MKVVLIYQAEDPLLRWLAINLVCRRMVEGARLIELVAVNPGVLAAIAATIGSGPVIADRTCWSSLVAISRALEQPEPIDAYGWLDKGEDPAAVVTMDQEGRQARLLDDVQQQLIDWCERCH